MPTGIVVLAEVFEGGRKGLPGSGEVRGRARRSEEDRDIVKEAGAILFRREGKLFEHLPQVFGDRPRVGGIVAVAKLFLEAEPVAVRGGRILSKLLAEVLKESADVLGHFRIQSRRLTGGVAVGVHVTARRNGTFSSS